MADGRAVVDDQKFFHICPISLVCLSNSHVSRGTAQYPQDCTLAYMIPVLKNNEVVKLTDLSSIECYKGVKCNRPF